MAPLPTMPPTAFAGKPDQQQKEVTDAEQQAAHSQAQPEPVELIKLGDSLASRAKKLRKNRRPPKETDAN